MRFGINHYDFLPLGIFVHSRRKFLHSPKIRSYRNAAEHFHKQRDDGDRHRVRIDDYIRFFGKSNARGSESVRRDHRVIAVKIVPFLLKSP